MYSKPKPFLHSFACSVALCCMLLPIFCSATYPFYTQKSLVASKPISRTYVEFNIVNDLAEDYPFFLGGPNQISKGTTRTFNYPEGTEIFHLSSEGDKGKEWFTVNPDMHRQTYNLSEFVRTTP